MSGCRRCPGRCRAIHVSCHTFVSAKGHNAELVAPCRTTGDDRSHTGDPAMLPFRRCDHDQKTVERRRGGFSRSVPIKPGVPGGDGDRWHLVVEINVPNWSLDDRVGTTIHDPLGHTLACRGGSRSRTRSERRSTASADRSRRHLRVGDAERCRRVSPGRRVGGGERPASGSAAALEGRSLQWPPTGRSGRHLHAAPY